MTNELIFTISVNASIYFPLLIPPNELQLYSTTDLILCRTGHKNLLINSQYPLMCSLGILQDLIIALLRKQMEIPEIYVAQGIGYWANEYLNGKLYLHDEILDPKHTREHGSWKGDSLDLWGSSMSHVTVYLYSFQGKIYLEAAPMYPWTIDEPEPEDNYISYEEFMRTYQPIARFELSQKTIKDWLLQATDIINIMKRDAGWEDDVLPPDIVHLLDDIS